MFSSPCTAAHPPSAAKILTCLKFPDEFVKKHAATVSMICRGAEGRMNMNGTLRPWLTSSSLHSYHKIPLT